jgi:hypothetical protein
MTMKSTPKILMAASLIFAPLPACSFATSNPASSSAPSSSAPSSQPPEASPDAVPTWNGQGLSGLGTSGYTVDSARTASGTFDINDGKPLTLNVDDANGYSWMLWIPADALMKSETITMTPFATIDVSQSGAKIISGVRLEPDGIQFVNAVQLSVHAPEENPGVGLIFSLNQDGSDVDFAPTINAGKMTVAQIWHFSAAGYTNGYNAGQDGIDQYQKMAREEYRLALDAAKQFIKNGPPRPPASPDISMFCRGTEHNPDQNESYEFMRDFLDPYGEYVIVLLGAMKNVELLGVQDVDTTAGTNAIITILQMAEKTLLELGKQYQKDKPPDRLIAVISAGLQVDRQIQLINGDAPLMLIPEPLVSWAVTVRDYYLDQLKTKHDYRAFPVILTLEKNVQLLGGPDRFEEILSAMTFEVVLDTSFNGTWKSSDKVIATGSVVQTADVKDLKIVLTKEGLWGDLNNLPLKAKSGTYTDTNETTKLDGMTDTGVLFLKNWDPCVTKTFDVLIGGLYGEANSKPGTVAGPAAMVSFKQYYWQGATAFMFTIPIKNLDANMGEQTFTGSGSAAEGGFTGNGKIHIVLKHTPK